MNERQREYFREKLMRWREDALSGSQVAARLEQFATAHADLGSWASIEGAQSFMSDFCLIKTAMMRRVIEPSPIAPLRRPRLQLLLWLLGRSAGDEGISRCASCGL